MQISFKILNPTTLISKEILHGHSLFLENYIGLLDITDKYFVFGNGVNVTIQTYYSIPSSELWQKGIRWMLRGVIHLLTYRFIYKFILIEPSEVTGLYTMLQYIKFLHEYNDELHISACYCSDSIVGEDDSCYYGLVKKSSTGKRSTKL